MTKITLHQVARPRPRGRPRKVWMLRWYGTDGKRRGETLGECRTVSKRDAEAVRRDKQSKMDCGIVRPDKPARMTLQELAAYDRLVIADRRHKTVLEHDHAVAHAVKVFGKDVRVDRVTRPHVARLKAQMQEANYRPATIDKTVRILRAMWNRSMRDGLVVDNPFAGSGIKWDPRDSRIFAPREVEAMLAVAPDDWWRVFIRLMVNSGLRLREALHLRWADVDLDEGTVKVCRHDASTVTVRGKPYPLLPWSAKAKASYRSIPLHEVSVAELRRFKAKAGDSPYVFITLNRLADLGRRLQAETLRPNYEPVNNVLRGFQRIQRWARALLAERRGVTAEKVEWRMGCIHDLRDTYLTGIKGVPIDVLQRIAGHADIATTIRFYTKATDRDADIVRAAVSKSGLAGPVQDTLRTHPAFDSANPASAVAKKPAARYDEAALSA